MKISSEAKIVIQMFIGCSAITQNEMHCSTKCFPSMTVLNKVEHSYQLVYTCKSLTVSIMNILYMFIST